MPSNQQSQATAVPDSHPRSDNLQELLRKTAWSGRVAVAGVIGERLARRGSPGGWRKMLSRDEIKSFHEGAHAVTAWVAGKIITRASIIPDPNVRKNGWVQEGVVVAGWRPDATPTEAIQTDREAVVGIADIYLWGCGGKPNWKAVLAQIRLWRREVEALLEANWLEVIAVAQALQRHGELSAEQLERLLRPRRT